MRKLLIIVLLLSAFLFYSYADEKKKHVPWYLSSPGHYSYSTYPPSLFDPNYLDKHNRWQEYFNSLTYGSQRSAIVVPRPPSFGEAFLQGFSKGMSKGVDNYYRARQQKQDIKTMMALIKLKWASEGYRPKSSQLQRARPLPEYKMSPEERQANWERIIELDRIIKLKKERANLDKLFREAGWLDKDRIEYLDKYYPLPLTKEIKFNWLDKFPPPNKTEKPEDDIVKFAKSQGAMLPGEYKMKKLNEYLKLQNLPEVPLAFEVDKLFHGEWVIYWDGEKWARKKKEVNQEDPQP